MLKQAGEFASGAPGCPGDFDDSEASCLTFGSKSFDFEGLPEYQPDWNLVGGNFPWNVYISLEEAPQ